MSRFLIPLVAFLVFIPIFLVALFRDPSEIPSPFIDEPAPAFELPTLQNPARIVSNADLEGRAVLVNIWATWCVGCREEHEFLMQLARTGAVPIIGINWRDERSKAIEWLQALGDPYEFSGFDEFNRVGIDWGVYGAPETFLVNADGIVVYKHLGPLDAATWQREFVPRLGEEG
ncbi:MAG: DsbE family thiol:disulfide interchange protein [Pseudomonadota bacterium]